MCGSMVDIQSVAAEIRRGKKEEERKIEITGQKYNGLPYYIGRPLLYNVDQCQTRWPPSEYRWRPLLNADEQRPCSNAANIGERKTWTQSEF